MVSVVLGIAGASVIVWIHPESRLPVWGIHYVLFPCLVVGAIAFVLFAIIALWLEISAFCLEYHISRVQLVVTVLVGVPLDLAFRSTDTFDTSFLGLVETFAIACISLGAGYMADRLYNAVRSPTRSEVAERRRQEPT
jgi:hypothetical protein